MLIQHVYLPMCSWDFSHMQAALHNQGLCSTSPRKMYPFYSENFRQLQQSLAILFYPQSNQIVLTIALSRANIFLGLMAKQNHLYNVEFFGLEHRN